MSFPIAECKNMDFDGLPAATTAFPQPVSSWVRWIERRLRPRIVVHGRSRPAYGICIFIGLLMGIGLAAELARQGALSVPVALATAGAGLAAAALLAFATVALTGREGFTFFHYQLTVLAACGGVAAGLGRSPLAYLDLLSVGLAMVHALGRVGCLMAGCCYGCPHPRGIRYGRRHAKAGFPRSLVGVPLLPVPALELLGLLGLAALGSATILVDRSQGEAVTLYLAGYASGRFFLEFWRGDPERPYWRGFSEAQWTAFGLLVLMAASGGLGILPLAPWPLLGLAIVTAAMTVRALQRAFDPGRRREMLSSRHWTEVAGILASRASLAGSGSPAASQPPLSLSATSGGLRLSSARHADLGGRQIQHYSLSCARGFLPPKIAQALAERIVRLRHPSSAFELVAGRFGVFHVLVAAPQANENQQHTCAEFEAANRRPEMPVAPAAQSPHSLAGL